MKRVLTLALALSTAFAHVASAQATTKQNLSTSANARARGGASLTLSSNPVTRAYHKVAAAIGFGDSQPERVATPAARRTVAANNQNVQSTSRPGSSVAKPVVARPSQPAAVTTNTTASPAAAAKTTTAEPAPAAPKPAGDTPQRLIKPQGIAHESSGGRDPIFLLLSKSCLQTVPLELKNG